jgi:hypothetical protein
MAISPNVPLNGPKSLDQMTTVYVGKIPASAEDDFVRKLLEVCFLFESSIKCLAMWKSYTMEKSF